MLKTVLWIFLIVAVVIIAFKIFKKLLGALVLGIILLAILYFAGFL